MKVTVSKLQIQQAKNCVERLDKYTRLLDCAIEILNFAKSEASYKRLPENFKSDHRKSIDTCVFDLKSLKNDAQEMALLKTEKAEFLLRKRQEQLGAYYVAREVAND